MSKRVPIHIHIIGCIIIAVIVGIIFAGSPESQSVASQSTGTLAAAESSYDFGTITMKDGPVTHRFTVNNDSKAPITITKIATSCMCTTAIAIDTKGTKYGPFGMGGMGTTTATIELPAGQSLFVDATFDPNAHGPAGVGEINRVVYVESNSTTVPKLAFNFHATVTP